LTDQTDSAEKEEKPENTGKVHTAKELSGRYLAIAYEDGGDRIRVCVLDLKATEGTRTVRWETASSKEIRSFSFSPEGRRLLIAFGGGLVSVLERETGEVLRALHHPSGRPFNSAVFDNNGERIAVASADDKVRVYGSDSDEPLLTLSTYRSDGKVVKVHKSAVTDVAFTLTGRSLVAVDVEGQVVRWDIPDSRPPVAVVLGHHAQSVNLVRMSPETADPDASPLVLTASLDRTARLWDLGTGKKLAVFSHNQAVSNARFSTDGSRILTYSEQDGSARLWGVEPVSGLSISLPHDDHVWHLDVVSVPHFSGMEGIGLLVATAAYDGRVSVWPYDRTTGELVRDEVLTLEPRVPAAQGGRQIRRVSFSPSADLLAAASFDGTARVWHLATGTEACAVKAGTGSVPSRVNYALFAPDEDWLVTASEDAAQPLRFWRLDYGQGCPPLEVEGRLPTWDAPVESLTLGRAPEAWEGEDVLIAAGTESGLLRVLRRSSRGELSVFCEHQLQTGAVHDLSFSPDGQLLAIAGEDGAALVRLRETRKTCGVPRDLKGHSKRIYSVRFAPEGERLVTASLDKTAKVWRSDGALLATLRGHTDRIFHAELSPDGDWILTASRDGRVRIWETPKVYGGEMESYLMLDGQLGGVSYAAFSPDGNYIAAAYWESAALIWRLWNDDSGGRLADWNADALREYPRSGDGAHVVYGSPKGRDEAWSRLSIVSEAERFRADKGLD
jgi:WD40 repeat protein